MTRIEEQPEVIVYNYSLRVTFYDENGNVTSRKEYNYKTLLDAMKDKKKLKKRYDEKKILFVIDVIRLSESRIVETSKSKRLRKINGKIIKIKK